MNLKYIHYKIGSLFEVSYKKKNEPFHHILIFWDIPVFILL